MYMVREVLHCRPGRVGDLAKKFRSLGTVMKELGLEPFRLYTDVAGSRFWTLVLERDYETLDEITAVESRVMSDERSRSVMAGYHDLVVKGSREIYKVES